MPNLADIPDVFLDARLKLPFLEWLKVLPIDDETRKQLLAVWSKATGEPYTVADINAITPL